MSDRVEGICIAVIVWACMTSLVVVGYAIGHTEARQQYQPMACEARVIDTIRVRVRP